MISKHGKDYKKIVGFWVVVFLLGGVAGILGSNLFLPWLAGFPLFGKIDWIRQAREGTTIINRTERVAITQDFAYQEAIGRLVNSVVGIKAERHYRFVNQKQVPLVKPEILAQGTGFILTSDGAIVIANSLVPETATRIIVTQGGKETEAQVIKRDQQNNLALLKTNENNLSVVTLVDAESLKLGEVVFLVGVDNSTTTPAYFVNSGLIRSLSPEISFNFSENQAALGGPMANIKGEVLGLNLIGRDGKIKIVGTDKIRELLR